MTQPIKTIEKFGLLLTILKRFKLSDLIFFFLFNISCGILSAITGAYVGDGGSAYFIEQWPRFSIVYLALSFAVMFFYLWRAMPKFHSLNLSDFIYISVNAFFLSLVLSSIAFNWFTSDKILKGTFYLFSFMASSGWIMILMYFFKVRVISPRIQGMMIELKESNEQRDKAEAELHLLQAQIEPHFFYNTLANLHSLIDLDARKAKNLLEELTEFFRSCIPQFRLPWILLSDEIAMVERYLNIQKIRFEGLLSYHIDINPLLMKESILPLSILTLVENSVKHGLEKQLGGTIDITVSKTEDFMIVQVKDHAAQPFAETSGTGLINLESRLNIAYKGLASFKLMSVDNQFTLAEFKVPLL